MNLVPKRPPGRITRKARTYATEIWQLREQGYTFEAIREALAGAGICVSNTTVQREVARYTKRNASPPPSEPDAGSNPSDPFPSPPMPTERPTAVQSTSACSNALTGKDIAEAFMRNRITNPLLRNKEP